MTGAIKYFLLINMVELTIYKKSITEIAVKKDPNVITSLKPI